MRSVLLTTAVLASLTVAAAARGAEPLDAPGADALFQRAKEALRQGDLATACAEFAESQRLDPEVGTLLNLADCEERSGKLAAALEHFRAAADRLPAGDFRIPFAQERIGKLAARVPRLTLKVKGPVVEGTSVVRDDVTLGAASLGIALPVERGAHVCVLRVPGHADQRVEVTLAEGEGKTLELSPGPALPEKAAAPGPAPLTTGSSGTTQRTLGVVAAGVGIAGIATGAFYGLKSKSTYDDATSHCPSGPSSCDGQGVQLGQDAHGQATLSTIAFIAGGALVVGGAVLYFTAPRGTRVTVTATAGPRATGLEVVGAW